MDGIHDMGGLDGFGKIPIDHDEPIFHAAWEGRAIALATMISAVEGFTDDHYRQEIERLAPTDYLSATYYERWVVAMERLLRQAGVIEEGESPQGDAKPLNPDVLLAADLPAAISEGFPRRMPDSASVPRFAVGDLVEVRNMRSPGHARLPRYLRGKRGQVISDHGLFPFPEAVAAGRAEAPQRVYSVLFQTQEVWGPDAPSGDSLVADLWEAYLQAQ